MQITVAKARPYAIGFGVGAAAGVTAAQAELVAEILRTFLTLVREQGPLPAMAILAFVGSMGLNFYMINKMYVSKEREVKRISDEKKQLQKTILKQVPTSSSSDE